MTEFASTNAKIAELLLQQTYAERLDMARALTDALNDAKASMSPSDGFHPDDVASLLEGWADAEIEEPSHD